MLKFCICGIPTLLIVFLPSISYGSMYTIGPNGINSAGLTLIDGMTPLTGDGINIGQVESRRPGVPMFDSAPNRNIFIKPTDVTIRDGLAPQADAVSELDIDWHPLLVAGVMISSDQFDDNNNGDAPTGVAKEADLYSSAFLNVTGTPAGHAIVIRTIQYVASISDMRAVNHSWGIQKLNPGDSLDGNSQLTLALDWSARQHNVLHIKAGNQSSMVPIPSDNFNGMTIGRSSKIDGVYRQVSPNNSFDEDAEGERTSISLIAPGDDLELATGGTSELTYLGGTSFATPHVTGTVALLQQYANQRISVGAWNATSARRHEVMKAVLINSADKIIDDDTYTHPSISLPVPLGGFLGMERTVVMQNGNSTWFDSPAVSDEFVPLDIQMGAGHLNAKRALQQFENGETNADGGPADVIGWDYGMTTGEDDINKYQFGQQQFLEGSFISITLAWDRIIDFDDDMGTANVYDIGDSFRASDPGPGGVDNDDLINDLDLYLMPAGAFSIGEAIASSISIVGTVEHIFFQIPETAEYEIWVHQYDADIAGGQDYGIAWWALRDESVVAQAGDFDGDGDVDGEDFVVWQDNFPTTNGASFFDGDADGDGDVDGADFVVWQTNFPFTPGAGTSPVPEPPTILGFASAAMALVFVRRRKVSIHILPHHA